MTFDHDYAAQTRSRSPVPLAIAAWSPVLWR